MSGVLAVVVVRMRMEAAVYEDIVGSLRARAWGDLDTMQEEMGREFPAVAAQSIRSILYQAHSSFYSACTFSIQKPRQIVYYSSFIIIFRQEFQRHVKATFRSEHSDANKAAVCSR